MKKTLFAGLLALAGAALAAPQKDPLAEGYLDWTGITAKNYLYGRTITPSDLRQRVVIFVAVDDAAFGQSAFQNFEYLVKKADLPASHATQWETQELPRDHIVVFSVLNAAKDTTVETFKTRFKAPKDAAAGESALCGMFANNLVPFYKNLAPVGGPELSTEQLPYVAVYGASGTEPLFKKEKFTMASNKELGMAVRKGDETLPQDWTPPFGIREPQFMKTVPALYAKGKPATAMFPILKAGIKAKDPEQAKEAQIMYDALNQYNTDLKVRIASEVHSAPARAYYDFQILVKLFPTEKKKFADLDAKFKQNKELGSLGKCFEKLMLWGRDDFVCKNAGEAKKIVQELQKIKKNLEILQASQNMAIQGEAMLFTAQIDSLIETIPTKLPQK